jgi:hypothetical protein
VIVKLCGRREIRFIKKIIKKIEDIIFIEEFFFLDLIIGVISLFKNFTINLKVTSNFLFIVDFI